VKENWMRKLSEVERLFSEAHVIDVDFSRWYESIVLLVIAGHWREPAGGRLPTLVVEFVKPVRCDWDAVDSRKHCEQFGVTGSVFWHIQQADVSKGSEGRTVVKLWGESGSPHMTVECTSIWISEVVPSVIDRAFPGFMRSIDASFIRDNIKSVLLGPTDDGS